MSRARLPILLGTLLAAAGLVAWFLWGRLEWSEREVWTGYSGEARFNDFLACQRLLERMGQRARDVVASEYSLEVVGARLRAVYEGLIERSGKERAA